MKTSHRILVSTIAALLAGTSAHAATFQWDGGAATGDWQTALNWNPDVVAAFNNTGANRLNVNGPTTLIYSAAEGTTVYANPGLRGLVIGSGALGAGSMIISGGSFSTLGSTQPDVIGNGNIPNQTSSLTITGGSFIGNTAGLLVNFSATSQTCLLNISGGSATLATLTVSNGGNGSGTVNLDGGILAANQVNRTFGNGTFNFNGGTLQARQSITNFLQGLTAANVKSGGAVIDTNGFDITVAQALLDGGGGGGLVKMGAGTLTLTGGNTYTGSTTINAGTLQIGDGGATGAIGAGSILNNGQLVINRTGTLAFHDISGTGGVDFLAPTTTTLSGTNTYLGATNINAGQVNLAGTFTSNITVADGANLGGEGSTAGSLTFGGASTLFFSPSTPAHLTAASINASAATITLNLTTNAAGTGIVVLEAAGGITGTAGTNFLFSGRGTTYLNGTHTQLLFDYTPATMKWKGNDASLPTAWNVETTVNWTNGVPPDKFFNGDFVTFDDTASSFTVDVDGAGVTPGSVNFNNAGTDYTVQGGAIGGNAAVTKSGSAKVTIANDNTYTGGTTISAGAIQLGDGASGTGALGTGPIVNNAILITNFGSSTNTIANAIGGTGLFDQQSPGTVVLTGANTYSGPTFISAGTLQIGNGGATGSLGSGTVANQTTLAFNRSDAALVVANTISGTGNVNKLGAGTVTFTGANTYEGLTSILAGALRAGSATALGSVAAGTEIANLAALELSGGITFAAEPLTLNGGGTGAGQTGALRSISGNNIWTGNIVANPVGTVSRISADADLLTVTGNITVNGGTADQLSQGAGNVTVTGVISGTSGITSSSNGAGVRTLAGANTYTGVTRINGGTLVASTLNSVNGGTPLLPASSLGAPTDAVTGTITIGSAANLGASTLRYVGTGETTDRGVAFPGGPGTNVIEHAGTGLLKFISGITATAVGAKTLVLQGSPAGSGEVAGVISNGSDTVGVTKAGTGTWTLSATNTYTGATNVNNGTLVFAADQTLTALNIADGATAILAAPAPAPAPEFGGAFAGEITGGNAAPVPEPGTVFSLLTGMFALVGKRRRRE